MALASLADLPNELLVDILGQSTFPTEALYYLALLSRRLHFVALYQSNFLALALTSKQNVPPLPWTATDWSLSLRYKYACSFPRWIPSSASFRIPVASPFPLSSRLQTFISRLSSIKSVTLNLGSRPRAAAAVNVDYISLTGVDTHNEPEAFASLVRLPRLVDLVTHTYPYWGDHVLRNKKPHPVSSTYMPPPA
ncbi:hypothetical protein MVEN_00172100 [Mycena venus]|uniref:F-box domain-containing protein n=1 Tax=Mycena venus TaxID=2733690 RepID=A0A8H6Z021_9AGAR|nr:hypothetical protein MVEN_00172100 [Mycena venus]